MDHRNNNASLRTDDSDDEGEQKSRELKAPRTGGQTP